MKCLICDEPMSLREEDLYQCNRCTMISSNLPPRVEIYDRDYHQKYVSYSGTQLGYDLAQFRWSFVSGYMPHGSILDYGCGSGHFESMNPNGTLHVKGFDINPYSGYRHGSVFLQQYDAVTFWDSLEHVERPDWIIKWLDTDWVFATVPDCGHLSPYHILNWKHYRPGEHIHYFNSWTIKAFLRSLGYEICGCNHGEGVLRDGANSDWLVTVAARKARR